MTLAKTLAEADGLWSKAFGDLTSNAEACRLLTARLADGTAEGELGGKILRLMPLLRQGQPEPETTREENEVAEITASLLDHPIFLLFLF